MWQISLFLENKIIFFIRTTLGLLNFLILSLYLNKLINLLKMIYRSLLYLVVSLSSLLWLRKEYWFIRVLKEYSPRWLAIFCIFIQGHWFLFDFNIYYYVTNNEMKFLTKTWTCMMDNIKYFIKNNKMIQFSEKFGWKHSYLQFYYFLAVSDILDHISPDKSLHWLNKIIQKHRIKIIKIIFQLMNKT